MTVNTKKDLDRSFWLPVLAQAEYAVGKDLGLTPERDVADLSPTLMKTEYYWWLQGSFKGSPLAISKLAAPIIQFLGVMMRYSALQKTEGANISKERFELGQIILGFNPNTPGLSVPWLRHGIESCTTDRMDKIDFQKFDDGNCAYMYASMPDSYSDISPKTGTPSLKPAPMTAKASFQHIVKLSEKGEFYAKVTKVAIAALAICAAVFAFGYGQGVSLMMKGGAVGAIASGVAAVGSYVYKERLVKNWLAIEALPEESRV